MLVSQIKERKAKEGDSEHSKAQTLPSQQPESGDVSLSRQLQEEEAAEERNKQGEKGGGGGKTRLY